MVFSEIKNSNFGISNTPFPLINSVLIGLQEGRVFSDDGIYFIIHKSGFSYLTFKVDIDYQQILDFFIQWDQLPDYFHLYDATQELIRISKENSDRINTRLRKRVQLKFSNGQLLPAYSILPRFTFTDQPETILKICPSSIFHWTINSGIQKLIFWRMVWIYPK